MKKSPPLTAVLLSSMALTQVLFTFLVYRSNLQLYHATSLILSAEYIAIPNALVLPSLLRLETAAMGGLFFTLTLGIALPFFLYIARWIWNRGFQVCCIHGLALLLLGSAFMTEGTDLFINFRNRILLTHPAGTFLSDLYYRYTSYPTEAIKSLSQKQVKPCRVEASGEDLSRVKNILRRYDYLPLATPSSPDILFSLSGKDIIVAVDGKKVLTADASSFKTAPGDILRRLSDRCDRHKLTRLLLALSLTIGIPLFLYAFLVSILQKLLMGFIPGTVGTLLSAAACLLILFGFMWKAELLFPSSIPVSALSAALSSSDPDTRVAALRTISEKGLDPADFTKDSPLLFRPYLPERIGWAISLSRSRHPEAEKALLLLLDDPKTNVSCMAYRSIGIRKEKADISPILARIKTLPHWYVQGYAYQTLRKLGWKQTASP